MRGIFAAAHLCAALRGICFAHVPVRNGGVVLDVLLKYNNHQIFGSPEMEHLAVPETSWKQREPIHASLHTAGNLKLAAHSLMCKHCFPLLVQNVPFVKASSTAYVLSHVFGLLQTPEWIVVQHSGPQWARVMFTYVYCTRNISTPFNTRVRGPK